ncbi:MAG: translation elongation factor Ts [Spirochaetaceae bacterium]|nr:translation elongation factor Ts [Spirochaetaceae bacterium]
MDITAADVKKLRDKTGAGPMECKKALLETDGDFDRAEKLLKEKGLAAVEKRADRATNEGKIFIAVTADRSRAALVELSSETDFVARNPEFIELGGKVAEKALAEGITAPTEALSGMVTELATKIRENMNLKRLAVVTAGNGEYLTSYLHGGGAIGVAVKIAADSPAALEKEEVKSLAFNLALHIAAFNPLALDRTGVDQGWIQEQEQLFRRQMEGDEKFGRMKETKPDQFEKILQGKVNKLLQESCLLEQGFVKDEKLSVEKVLAETGKAAGSALRVAEYVYYRVGG